MEEEYDYMSDDIIAECSKNDIRPGLIYNKSQQRQHEIQKKKVETDEKNKQQYRPLRVLESERRNEGLQEAIGENNKGFAMLQKMGYKAGQAIGKTGDGILDPVQINIKTDRKGLGRETVLKEIAERKAQIRARYLEKNVDDNDFNNYRSRMTQKAQERRDEGDFKRSQRICEELDIKKDIEMPSETWFWPRKEKPEEEKEDDNDKEDDEEEESEDDELMYSTSEKLEMLTLYLRRTHMYCIWCGTQFDDEKDMQDECPGPTRDDH